MDDSVVGDNNPPRGKEKRFSCSFCDRLFARKEHADRHERTHTQEKPFHCPQCDSRFTRSDLLVRHERLTHKKENAEPDDESYPTTTSKKRKRARNLVEEQDSSIASSSETTNRYVSTHPITSSPTIYRDPPTFAPNRDRGHDFLATLSFAAEQAALQDSMASPATNMHSTLTAPNASYGYPRSEPAPYLLQSSLSQSRYSIPAPAAPMSAVTCQPEDLSLTVQDPGMDFEGSLDSLTGFLDNGALPSYHYSSIISAEQPVPFFSPESLSFEGDALPDRSTHTAPHNHTSSPSRFEDQTSFSRFGSRLPSLQPEERNVQSKPHKSKRPIADLSLPDLQVIIGKFAQFSSTVSAEFKLPSRLALSRYLAAYISGFHEHLPFLHIPTMTVESCSIELILAMAAVGAQYCFEGDRGVELFHASQAIASKRIRRKDMRLAASRREYRSSSAYSRDSNSYSGPLGPTSYAGTPVPESAQTEEDMMQTAQALLLLMAMATWAKHKEFLREALAIQSTLATLVRDDGLKSVQLDSHASWEEWVRMETVKRTKFIVFCFFNLHCIVYNIPPLILNSELKLTLPASAAEFKAASSLEWQEAKKKAAKPTTFESALGRLFSKSGRDITEWNSSLGNYILIHAIIQHIFFVRQTAKCRFNSSGELLSEDVSALEQALRNWQAGWRRNPESSLDPMDPNGPVAFNSTALLRLAYIRLSVDTGPGRSLDTRDPFQIANAFRDSPAIRRTPKLVRAVLHSAHALSIPIKIGIRLVAQTQTFIWSIQHSLCSLECAFLLSKWLEALSMPNPEPAVTEDEKRIVGLVKTMLDETEFAVPSELQAESAARYKHLSAGVLRVWATIFRGAQTWAIVDVIGSSLNIYADMLEGDLTLL